MSKGFLLIAAARTLGRLRESCSGDPERTNSPSQARGGLSSTNSWCWIKERKKDMCPRSLKIGARRNYWCPGRISDQVSRDR